MASFEMGTDRTTSTTELWPVAWMRPVDPRQAAYGMEYLSQLIADTGLVASLSLVIRSHPDSGISAWIGANAIDPASVALVRRLTDTAVDFLGYGEPTPTLDPPPGDRALHFAIEDADDYERVGTRASSLWRFLAAAQRPWQMTVSAGEHGPWSHGDTDLGISLIGSGDEISAAGALLQADVLGLRCDRRLVPMHVDSGAALEKLRVDAALGQASLAGVVSRSLAAQFLSMFARVEGSWATVPVPPLGQDAVLQAIETATPPHVLIQGGSGLGKTTLLEHSILGDVAAGVPVLVVCPHGDLARRAAAHLAAAGAPVRMVDFGAEQPVLWNLTVPDPGMKAEEHAGLLLDTLRRLWPGTSADFFGPVWSRITRTLLTILVADPAGPWPLTRFPELLEVDSPFRTEALDRMDDEQVAGVMVRELVPMLESRDPGNTVAWIASKLDPLVGDPTLRAIIDTPIGTFPVDGLLAGESLVVAIPEGKLTDEAARLLAGLTLGRVWRMVKRRPPDRPIHVYLDEWQRMAIPAIGEMLAEGRKYGVKLLLANQNTAQVPARLWETAAANTGAVVSFRAGPRDAERIELRYPSLVSGQLTSLPDHWVAISVGDSDGVAASPAPLPKDGGRALRDGHAVSVDETRAALHKVVARRMAEHIANTQRRLRLPVPGAEQEERSAPLDNLDKWLALRKKRLEKERTRGADPTDPLGAV